MKPSEKFSNSYLVVFVCFFEEKEVSKKMSHKIRGDEKQTEKINRGSNTLRNMKKQEKRARREKKFVMGMRKIVF